MASRNPGWNTRVADKDGYCKPCGRMVEHRNRHMLHVHRQSWGLYLYNSEEKGRVFEMWEHERR